MRKIYVKPEVAELEIENVEMICVSGDALQVTSSSMSDGSSIDWGGSTDDEDNKDMTFDPD